MRQQKPNFRQKETDFVMKRWLASESCSLVGIGSVGKSNLLHHIANPITVSRYLNESSRNSNPHVHKAIIIDSNMLGIVSPLNGAQQEAMQAWSGYELMMHRLYLAFYPFEGTLRPYAEDFYAAYQSLQDGTNPLFHYMGLRYFELGLEILLRNDVKIMFLFDEFEELFSAMPMRFFQTLRGLRDAHKNKLSYLTFSRKSLNELSDAANIQRAQFEPFLELFSDNTYYVGPYNQQDATDMLERLSAKHQIAINEKMKTIILALSGGFAGILRTIFHLVHFIDDEMIYAYDSFHNAAPTLAPYMRKLIQHPSIIAELRVLLDSLNEKEQDMLTRISLDPNTKLTTSDEETVRSLILKQLLYFHSESQQLISTVRILDLYLANTGNEK